MTLAITYFGPNSYNNAQAFENSVGPDQIIVNTNSTPTVLNGTLTLGRDVITIAARGNFQYNGPFSNLSAVSGKLTEYTLSLNGTLFEQMSVTSGTDVLNWFFPSETIAPYLFLASTFDQGVVYVGSRDETPYADTLIGGKSKDFFTSFAGKVQEEDGAAYFDGKGGVDTAIFQGNLRDYRIFEAEVTDNTDVTYTAQLPAWVVEDTVDLRNGDTALINVERLQFADTMLALDIAPNQTAGKVYMLYQATFNRTPDAEGLGYWIKQVDNGANITTDVAAFFVTSPEFVTKYGANPSIASYVDNLYLNVLGRPGEAGGVAYWNKELNAGTITRAAVLEAFATLPEGAALVADAIANGIQYQEWLG